MENYLYRTSTLFVLTVLLCSCSKISLSVPGAGKTANGKSCAQPKSNGAEAGKSAQALAGAPLEGCWKVAFKLSNGVGKSNLEIHQQGGSFSGSGTDDGSSRPFNITGTIDGQHVQFLKQYAPDNSGQEVPPVTYDGTLETVNDTDYQGPYMSGQYNTQVNGSKLSDNWEAQLANPGSTRAETQAPPKAGSQPCGQSGALGIKPSPAGHAPDLSGKWNVAYECDFKTIKSIMFLEQEADRLSGRGIDINTNEKFEIAKGWYAYPKVTVIRAYKMGKGSAASNRIMEFKGTVEWENDKDYQGPYLHGETQGGGEWEAQLVR